MLADDRYSAGARAFAGLYPGDRIGAITEQAIARIEARIPAVQA
jgi:hypothetical protein